MIPASLIYVAVMLTLIGGEIAGAICVFIYKTIIPTSLKFLLR